MRILKKSIWLILAILILLTGCSKNPVKDKKISIKDNVGLLIEPYTSLGGIYYVSFDTENSLSKTVFIPKSTELSEAILEAEEKNDEKKLEYLNNLKSEFWGWIMNSKEYYSLTLSQNKVKEGETITVKFELTEKGRQSAEVLEYEFTDTEFTYVVKNGELVLN